VLERERERERDRKTPLATGKFSRYHPLPGEGSTVQINTGNLFVTGPNAAEYVDLSSVSGFSEISDKNVDLKQNGHLSFKFLIAEGA